jgi:hypothetical protein
MGVFSSRIYAALGGIIKQGKLKEKEKLFTSEG